MRKVEKRTQPRAGGVTFRGDPVTAQNQARIRKLALRHAGATRTEIAMRVCRMFGWKRANGLAPVRGCLSLLEKLERMGELELPPSKRNGHPRAGAEQRSARPAWPQKGEDTCRRLAAEDRLHVRLAEAGERHEWSAWMDRFHYLGDCRLVGESLRYLALLGDEPAALLSWGAASLRNEPRDRLIGWSPEAKAKGLPKVVANIRFLVLPWARMPNLASMALGANLRRLSSDWQRAYGHGLLLAETFVDISRFSGACYRASNWRYVGRTKGFGRRGRKYFYHGQPKAVFLYPLHRRAIELLRAGEPQRDGRDKDKNKEESMRTLTRIDFPLDGEDGLFTVLNTIQDPRKRRGIRYQLCTFLAIAVCAVLAGAKGFSAICEWAMDQSPEFRRLLGCRRGKVPSVRQFRRIFQLISADEFDSKAGRWVARHIDFNGVGLAIDGKTLRGSKDGDGGKPVHLLSALVTGSCQVVAQTAVDKKTNEITRVRPLFKGLDISGAVVTGDALLAQRKIACHVVDDKGADYVFVIKENQLSLFRDIELLFSEEKRKAERQSKGGKDGKNSHPFPPSGENIGEGSWSHRIPRDLDEHGSEQLC